MAGIIASGIGSNLDVASLVQQLMKAESAPLAKLATKEAAAQVKISALGSFRGALSGFQGALKALTDPSSFTVMKSGIGDATVASVSASDKAGEGSYSLEVTNLAKSQKLSTGTFSSLTEPVGSGTITIQYGTYDSTANSFSVNGERGSQSITIDGAHTSLAGVRDAINEAKVGVTASIINDGSGYRLVMSAKDTGAANSVRLSVTDDDGDPNDASGLSRLAYDPTASAGTGKNMSQLMAAEDATMIIDGLTVKSSSNTVSNVIDGVTLSLLKTNAGSPTKVTVSEDTSGVSKAIDSFVKAYNDLNKTIKDLTAYNPETKQAAALQGDAGLRSIASDIRNGLSDFASGNVGSYKGLAQIGLTFDRSGNLKLDSGKLSAALADDPTGVQALFANAAKTDDPLVSYVGSSATSKAGNYPLEITSLATRGSLTGSSAAGLTINGTNDTLSLKVDGTSLTVKLAQKTYASHSELMAELQSKINGSTNLKNAGGGVTVSDTGGGVFNLTSAKYGSKSTVTVSGNAALNLFGTPTSTDGTDVAGTIGGALATGKGQRLTGTGVAEGLEIDITGGATGSRGTLQYGVGVAGQLDEMMTKLLGSKGLLAARTENLQGQVKQIEADRERVTERLTQVEARYTKQFNALDQQLSATQSLSAYLSQQLAALPKSGG